MYGIFTYIWVIYGVSVGKYSIHGSYGILSFDVLRTAPLPRQGLSVSLRTRVASGVAWTFFGAAKQMAANGFFHSRYTWGVE